VTWLLNLVYLLVLLLALPQLLWVSIRHGKYRSGLAGRLLGRVPFRKGDRRCVWFHAVSLGEVNLLRPLIAQFQRCYPQWQIVVSTTSATGYSLAVARYGPESAFYCPLDFSWSVRTALRRIRPDLFVLAELEIWPNLIRLARRSGTRVAVVNGRLSERSFRGYRLLGGWIAGVLKSVDLIAAQNDAYAERFIALGARRKDVHVTGCLKFDGAETDRHNPHTARLRQLAGFADGDLIFLAGSTQDPEEEMALETFQALRPHFPRLRLVLVPRHPERFAAVAEMLRSRQIDFGLRSRLDRSPESRRSEVLLVDTVGELSAWWGTAAAAFVGGSFGTRGGQNMIEPAAYGAAVCFGPQTRNFRHVVAALLARDAAVVVHDQNELTAFVRRVLDDPQFAARLGRQARQLVQQNLGATDRTLQHIAALVPPPQRSCSADAA